MRDLCVRPTGSDTPRGCKARNSAELSFTTCAKSADGKSKKTLVLISIVNESQASILTAS